MYFKYEEYIVWIAENIPKYRFSFITYTSYAINIIYPTSIFYNVGKYNAITLYL